MYPNALTLTRVRWVAVVLLGKKQNGFLVPVWLYCPPTLGQIDRIWRWFG